MGTDDIHPTTLPLRRITRVRLKTTKHTKHTKHRRSGIIWRAVAPFHEMMIFNPFVPIRAHSWFWVLFVYFVSIRGSEFSFRVFRVFRGSIHSRPFVVLSPFRALRAFRVFPLIRVHSWPFVPIRGSESFSCISCVTWFHSWLPGQFQRKNFSRKCWRRLVFRGFVPTITVGD